jgi:hypothetical protein
MDTGKVEIGNVIVPAGDRGEQLIANLILALIASELQSDATASEYVARAHALARDLAAQSLIYRPCNPPNLLASRAGWTAKPRSSYCQ